MQMRWRQLARAEMDVVVSVHESVFDLWQSHSGKFRECAGKDGQMDPAELVDVLRSLGAHVTERIARNILGQVLCMQKRCAIAWYHT